MTYSTPLVSVVIPTFNRPQFLARAVNSALAGMDSKDIEVIVVPNGPDQSWQESLAEFKNNSSVRVIPIPESNANIARNTGMANARGEFIRFLDDDDYLIPEGAIKQYELIQSTGADVVSGSMQSRDSINRIIEVKHQPDTDDLCVAVLGPLRRCNPLIHVYRKSKLRSVIWSPTTPIIQDQEWLYSLCASQELKWIRNCDIAGVWQHHSGKRISTSKKINDINKFIVMNLIQVYTELEYKNRLTFARKRAITEGLLSCVHSVFYIEPLYWINILKKANQLDPEARPIQPIYYYPVLKNLKVLTILWITLPKKWLTHCYKNFLDNAPK